MKSVDEYIGGQPEEFRAKLEVVRAAVRWVATEAAELVSYGMAGYKLGGKRLMFFAGWKEHWSLYPVGKREQSLFAKELKGLEVDGSTVRIPWRAKVPVKLIEGLVKFRAEGVLGHSPRNATGRHGEKQGKKGAG